MKIKTLWRVLIIGLLSGAVSCTKEIESADEHAAVEPMKVFSLTATNGDDDTKLAFDEDGLGTMWQPGDKLYLIDVTGANSTVTLTTNITAPSKKASFVSATSVLSGDYVVAYGTSIEWVNIRSVCKTGKADQSGNLILCGSLHIEDGQTSASINLKHALSKLSFNFINVPGSLSSLQFGFVVTSLGMVRSGNLTPDGFVYESSNTDFRVHFGAIDAPQTCALVAPFDATGSKVYFYAYEEFSTSGYTVYEFAKEGRELKAGTNYNITLDFSKANNVSRILRNSSSYYEISTAAEFRAASYLGSNATYVKLAADIDFANVPITPLECSTLDGNGRTLSNVVINLSKVDNIGITRNASVSNLKVKNTTVSGRSYVGAISGSGRECSNCLVMGTSRASGESDYVGGITGSCNLSCCGAECDVTGANYVGGVAGEGVCDKCYHKGTVTGKKFIGGVSGQYYCTNSYNIGDVVSTTGSSYCAGISGDGYYSYNCYSNGNVSSGYGISFDLGNDYRNLTSCARLSSYNSSMNDNCNCGPSKTFLSKLTVINDQEAYSTQTWKDNNAGCPILQWQAELLNGDTDAPGFGNEDW